MSCSHHSFGFFLLVFLGFVFSQASCLQFLFSSFNKDDGKKLLYTTSPEISTGALRIDSESDLYENSPIRILYKEPFASCRDKRTPVESFDSSFIFSMDSSSEGLAFILTSDLTVPSKSHGQWLGIVDPATNGSCRSDIFAIEFDTRKSYPDDIDNNHVAVHANCMNSIRQIPLDRFHVNLSSGLDVIAHVRYDGNTKNMTIDITMSNDPRTFHLVPLLQLPIDLSKTLLGNIYVGFSASTGQLSQFPRVKSWNFTSKHAPNFTNNKHAWMKSRKRMIYIPTVMLLTIVFGMGFLCYLRRRAVRIFQLRSESLELESIRIDSTLGPHKFRLKELKSATANFDPSHKLGQGGFVIVYRGLLDNKEVAVKRVARDSRQGREQFLAEVTTFSHARHKNLVKLIGWCCEGGELLLVYDLLPKGSLDKLIFSNGDSLSAAGDESILSWEKRHSIICGIASALCYLHNGCEMRVLHRDVKASNVMIDSDYNAKLGDFGLACVIQPDEESHHSTEAVSGTLGYIAPEYWLTGRASVQTDVFGFGVFMLEVASGRRPFEQHMNRYGVIIRSFKNSGSGRSHGGTNDSPTSSEIVDWVWELYGKQRLLEAADARLHGEFEEEQMSCVLMLALACCHPNPKERPSMSFALQVLTGEAASPVPPTEKPAFTWTDTNTLSDVDSFSWSVSGR